MNIPAGIRGLDMPAVLAARQQYGDNVQVHTGKTAGRQLWLNILKEPVILLLLAVTLVYLLTGATGEACFMLFALLVVYGISFYQDNRSRKALLALEKMAAPLSKVIRNGQVQAIPTAEVVVGDSMIVEEGETINADAIIQYSHDFSVNEAVLTGEAYPLAKSENGTEQEVYVYSGSTVVSGLAICTVKATGRQTRLGQLGNTLRSIPEEPTPLEVQIRRFVKGMALAGILMFVLVCLVSYWQSRQWLDSLLKGLTLGMSIIPEEIPVAFATFMALGAWRLMQEGVIVKKTKTVETLGSTTVLCVDKTGTITENRMSLQAVYVYEQDAFFLQPEWTQPAAASVIRYAMWASEPIPFDPMEKALHQAYETTAVTDERPAAALVQEYPLGGIPPMMTHVFDTGTGGRLVAAKGAPEAILQVTHLPEADRQRVLNRVNQLAGQGFRVIGVARAEPVLPMPARQQQLPFVFIGLVAFFDPPKADTGVVFRQLHAAGIQVKILTGDNATTTLAIAQQVMPGKQTRAIDGTVLSSLGPAALQEKLKQTAVFTRMFPEVKLAVINALKQSGEVVAMIGDGVNDALALKAAHIGIAMGKKGTEMARQSADLVLVKDELAALVNAVAAGRRIYTNIKKAVVYIIAIHIPIIFTVALPLFFHWRYPAILTPVHVIFLELVMGPTCSIAFEREPMEENAMRVPPRPKGAGLLSLREMGTGIVQGCIITAGVLLVYLHAVALNQTEIATRSAVFTTLVLANIFLTFSNRSLYYSFFYCLKARNYLLVGITALTLLWWLLVLYVPPFAAFFGVEPLPAQTMWYCLLAALVSVGWFEVWKWLARLRGKIKQETPAAE